MQTGKQTVRRNIVITKTQMNRSLVIALSLALSLLVSCAGKDIPPQSVNSGPVTVGFGVSGTATRTQINGDGISTSWMQDDRVSLWARNEAQEFTLNGQIFNIYYREAGNVGAYFTATLPQAMPEGRYTYYATYPQPESLDGTRATFTIHDVQDGRVGGGADIMIATPAEAAQLGPLEDDPDLSLTMRHMLHVLRFYIPEGCNTLGEPVERIVFTMPQQVTGKAAADITAPDGGMTLAEGGNTVTLQLDKPIDVSTAETFDYACAAIFPSAEYGADDVMQVSLYSASYAAEVDDILLADRTFAAGHVTPVPLRPKLKEFQNRIRFTITSNNLGEDIQTITLTAPEGVNWSETGSNVLSFDAANLNGGGYYDLDFDTYVSVALYEALANQPVTVQFESENAIVSSDITMPDTKTGENSTVPLTVPYLYYEDFAATTASTNYNDNNQTSTTSTGTDTAVDLASEYQWPQGWTGARCGLSAVQAVRICCRSEKAVGFPGTYNGRIDSPTMSALKAGKSVKIRISFNYSFNREGSKNSSYQHYLAFGYHNTAGPINASSGIGSWFSDPLLGYTIDANLASDLTGPLTGQFNNIDLAAEYIVNACNASTRFAWEAYINATSPDGYYNNWVYIDNIRVQIVK